MDSHARLHAELIAFLRQHCLACDQRHLVLLGWMVTGLLLSQTVCFDRWKRSIPLNSCLPASWQRRCRRWFSNRRIDPESLYDPRVLWAIQQWQQPGHTLHLALETTVLWNRFCVVAPSVVYHGRAIPLLWQTLEHPSASVSAEDEQEAILALEAGLPGEAMPQRPSLEENRHWLAQQVWTLPVLDQRSAEEILGYEDDGLCG